MARKPWDSRKTGPLEALTTSACVLLLGTMTYWVLFVVIPGSHGY